MIVVDASAVLELLLRRPRGESMGRRLLRETGPWACPHLLDVEVAHVLRRLALSRELSEERGRAILDDLAALRLRRYAHQLFLPRIWQLRNNLSAYDAAYVALAESLDASLVTCDAKLAASRGHDAEIELL